MAKRKAYDGPPVAVVEVEVAASCGASLLIDEVLDAFNVTAPEAYRNWRGYTVVSAQVPERLRLQGWAYLVGGGIEAVREWMLDNDLVVADVKYVWQRVYDGRTWKFAVKIGPRGERLTALDIANVQGIPDGKFLSLEEIPF